MRTMMCVHIPVEVGNKAIREGVLPRVVQQTLERTQAQAAYFLTEDGKRTAYFFFDLKDPSQIPQIAEPLFVALNASVTFAPCMTGDELGAGLQESAKSG